MITPNLNSILPGGKHIGLPRIFKLDEYIYEMIGSNLQVGQFEAAAHTRPAGHWTESQLLIGKNDEVVIIVEAAVDVVVVGVVVEVVVVVLSVVVVVVVGRVVVVRTGASVVSTLLTTVWIIDSWLRIF